ncbi:hypothetical protein PMSD_10905 [Paenibacillus macquariensis subsp. defensor]|nr:hypothetical protein PMSD_10905 [Paenibacillus macquariensis subsp. defensor]
MNAWETVEWFIISIDPIQHLTIPAMTGNDWARYGCLKIEIYQIADGYTNVHRKKRSEIKLTILPAQIGHC